MEVCRACLDPPFVCCVVDFEVDPEGAAGSRFSSLSPHWRKKADWKTTKYR
jgi:hypothetical protein